MTGAAAGRRPMLRVEGLGVRYGALVALEDLSWEVAAGEILGIIGPNGAGKSSCYDAATNMVRRSGRVFLDGAEVTDAPPHALAGLGLKRAFQQNAFFAEMSVLDNMAAVLQQARGTGLLASIFAPWRRWPRAPRARSGSRGPAAALRRAGGHAREPARQPALRHAAHALHRARLGHRRQGADAGRAGGRPGRRGHAAAARPARRAEGGGAALVVIEHHMDLIMSVADRIVVLDGGRRLATGTPREIQADPRVLEAYLGRAA